MHTGTQGTGDSGGAELEWPAGAIWQGRGVIRIRSLGALLWVTVEGDPEDYFLGPGNVMRLDAGRRKVVAQALRPGWVRVEVGDGVIDEHRTMSREGAGSILRNLLTQGRAFYALAQAAFAALTFLPPARRQVRSRASKED